MPRAPSSSGSTTTSRTSRQVSPGARVGSASSAVRAAASAACTSGSARNARAFRADPQVQEALRAARVDQLALPTLADGESWRDVRGFEPDVAALGARGMAFEQLDQLALDHLYGVRP